MEKLTYTNVRGESIEFDGSPFHLARVNGLGDVGAVIQRQKAPFQDGSTRIGNTLEERIISIEFLIVGENYAEVSQLRMQMSRVLNPSLDEGTLRYDNGYVAREIKASAESIPFFPDGPGNRIADIQKGLVSLVASNPYWLSVEKIEQLVVWEGGLTFPLKLPTKFARQSESKAKILLNEGDAETPLRITFNGPATAPIRIENKTTGDFIQVNQSLGVDERLEINTAFGQKRVEKVLADGTRFNAFHYIKRGSKFFNLVPGNNLLDYSTGEDYERAGVSIAWNNRYLSV